MAEIINFWCVLAVRDLQVSHQLLHERFGFLQGTDRCGRMEFSDARQVQTDARRM